MSADRLWRCHGEDHPGRDLTQDPAKNAQFYKDLFGLKEIAKTESPTTIRRLMSMPSPNTESDGVILDISETG